MKISYFYFKNLRNSEHFQFHTEFCDLIAEYGSEALNIKSLFDEYLNLYAAEDEAFLPIRKSATTGDMKKANHLRGVTFRGLSHSVKAAGNHFNTEMREAAKRLKIVLDTYGNLSRKPLNEGTSAIYNLLQELTGKYAPEVATLGINSWIARLDDNNKAFEALVKVRNDEISNKTELKMTETRVKLDAVYGSIVEQINALIVVQGEENYSSFAKKLNTFIEKYTTTLAQRRGTTKAKTPQ